MLFPVAATFGQDRGVVRFPEPVPNRYLVLLQHSIDPETVPDVAARLAAQHQGKLRFVMNNVANIFSVEMSDAQAEVLARHPLVLQVEEVAVVHPSEVQTLPPPAPLDWMNLWNLDRLDQWSTASLGNYQFCERARDVIAYVVDTGVMGDHQEFQRADGSSRVLRGACFANDCVENRGDTACPILPETGSERWLYAHGTAVTSILGGRTVGVAKDVTIVPIRVFACSTYQGPSSDSERFTQALDWIRSTSNPDRNHRPALLNLSVYASANDPAMTIFEEAVNRLVVDDMRPNPSTFWIGIPVIASANNQGMSTCVTSPARMAYRNDPAVATPGFASSGRVISVGGSGRREIDGVWRDVRWQCPMYDYEDCGHARCFAANGTFTDAFYGSNHGNTVDLYAPAHNVESAHTTATNAYRMNYVARSGTSFAAPLASAVAARIMQVEQNLTPQQVWHRIRDSAQVVPLPFDTSGVDQNGNPTSNHLLLLRRYASATCPTDYP